MTATTRRSSGSFEHEALFYAGEREFVARTSAFIRDAVSADEAILVAVSAPKIDLLRAELGPDAAGVRFEDMRELGRNPAWIIPAWADFVAEHEDSGRRLRGIGEPVTPDRRQEELVECERHEALLNVAFAGGIPWRLVCPYDAALLPHAVLDTARVNHPTLDERGDRGPSATYAGLEACGAPLADPLPEPNGPVATTAFSDTRSVRAFVEANAIALDGGERLDDLLLATSEIATNSIVHGGGAGTVRVWRDGDDIVCEIRDEGRIDDPLVGRRRPDVERPSGFGLWLATQVCDLVQVRSVDGGSVIRMRVSPRG